MIDYGSTSDDSGEMVSNDHATLLAEWKQRYPGDGFVSDGILDDALWGLAERKVAFLLKEAYGDPKNPRDWDLREYLGRRWDAHRMWWTAAHWSHVVQGLVGPLVTPYDQIKDDRIACRSALLSAAVVNIKKSNGRTLSNRADLDQYVRRDGDLIQRQVALVAPEILICGATWPLVRHLWTIRRRVAQWVVDVDGMLVLDFWHPAGWVRRKEHYYFLDQWLRSAETVRNARNARN